MGPLCERRPARKTPETHAQVLGVLHSDGLPEGRRLSADEHADLELHVKQLAGAEDGAPRRWVRLWVCSLWGAIHPRHDVRSGGLLGSLAEEGAPQASEFDWGRWSTAGHGATEQRVTMPHPVARPAGHIAPQPAPPRPGTGQRPRRAPQPGRWSLTANGHDGHDRIARRRRRRLGKRRLGGRSIRCRGLCSSRFGEGAALGGPEAVWPRPARDRPGTPTSTARGSRGTTSQDRSLEGLSLAPLPGRSPKRVSLATWVENGPHGLDFNGHKCFRLEFRGGRLGGVRAGLAGLGLRPARDPPHNGFLSETPAGRRSVRPNPSLEGFDVSDQQDPRVAETCKV